MHAHPDIHLPAHPFGMTMHLFGTYMLLGAFALAVMSGFWALRLSWMDNDRGLIWLERAQKGVGLLVFAASLILLQALMRRDFSFLYVADYTDTLLPWTYALSAFWAGQTGSFLFWALMMSGCGLIWSTRPGYADMPPRTRTFFWTFFFGVQAFFLLLLTTISNPFIQLSPAPAEGNGLNPLLQHPGMIFHPPLLFIGYAGLTIPACAGLASGLTETRQAWLQRVRNWFLGSWTFLTAGIVLGAWWSYMELGWGGYWAWDPVENASLIPWMSASAFLHTSIVGRQSQGLGRSNLFLVVLTFVLCLFATFLTRSGVLQSLHAFGGQGVGTPLLVAILACLVFMALGTAFSGFSSRQTQASLISREGLLLLLAWVLVAVGLVIILGTMWPVLSRLWSENTMGLDAGFYNRVCLPLMALILVLLPVCPWLGWREWKKSPGMLGLVGLALVIFLAVLWLTGIRHWLALSSAGLALTACVSMAAMVLTRRAVRRSRVRLGAYGVHLGLALLGLGIAISGPYKQIEESILSQGQAMTIDDLTLTYQELKTIQTQGMQAVQARIQVERKGEPLGLLTPERRFYRLFDQPFAEASVLPSLGKEIYATLLGTTEDEVIRVQIRINPLVNWIWIGGTMMCLFALVSVRRQKTEDRGQKTEGRGQRSEGRRQGQKRED